MTAISALVKVVDEGDGEGDDSYDHELTVERDIRIS